jgi:DNA repair photolyase
MYVYGDSSRMFINATLGCKSRCSYCYLPSLSYELNAKNLQVVPSHKLIITVESNPEFKPGRDGTIISLGCYSECWDESTRDVTIELIKHFLQKGNSIQFATKRHITIDDLRKIAPYIIWKGQLCIFISSSTVSKWNTLERGTDAPEIRFKSFYAASALDIPIYLYIKPVIKHVTGSDLGCYLSVIKTHPVTGVVVGKKFIEKNETSNVLLAPISNGKLMYCNSENGDSELFERFSAHIETYKESLHVVRLWRAYA